MNARTTWYCFVCVESLITIASIAAFRIAVLKGALMRGIDALPSATRALTETTWLWYVAVLLLVATGLFLGQSAKRRDVITYCVSVALIGLVGVAGLVALLAFVPVFSAAGKPLPFGHG